MKFPTALQQFKKCIILFLSGIICSILAYMIYAVNPINMIMQYKLMMRPDSLLFTLWKKPPLDVFVKVYIFNITNPEEFLKGKEKLNLKEIGPYVYKEVLENTNITWHANGTLSYIPKRTIIFNREMSVGDPKTDNVSVPNIPMLGISSALHDASFFFNFPWSRLINMLGSKPILNITVHDYLWGYEDSLVQLASGIVPNFINFQKFGLLDRMYDEGENVVFMNIKKNGNMTEERGRYLSIDTYNYSPGLSHWGYREEEGNKTYPENTICNRIRGATEGTIFPSNLDTHARFRIYRKAFCKAIPIVFQKKLITESGFEGYLYGIPDDFLDPPDVNPDNECYCRKMKKCLPKGLSDITPCYYNIPAAISLPHFMNADPELLNNVEGLHPDPKKHTASIILEPSVGVPMLVNSKLQINLIMHHTTYNSKIAPFNDMIVPILWTDLNIPSLPDDVVLLLKLGLQIMPVVQAIFICLLAIVGVTCIVFTLSSSVSIFKQEQQQYPSLERRDSADLRIPLSYGQYTSIHILPAVKKITSRSDLFN